MRESTVEFQDRERKRIASEIHDGLGQNLLVIKKEIQKCLKISSIEDATYGILKQIESITQQSIDEVREIAYNLHPHQLDILGLKGAIESTIDKARHSSEIIFQTYIHEVDNIFSASNEINIYRIVQEAINNIVKHSHASEATIFMEFKCDYIYISLSDNGSGFKINPKKPEEIYNKSLGLASISERVKILKGRLYIKSILGEGSILIIKIPIPMR